MARFTKLAVVAVFTVAVGGGAALALSAATTSGPKPAGPGRLDGLTNKVVGAGPVVDGVVVANGTTDGPASSSTSAGGSFSGSRTAAGASSGATTGQGNAAGGATTGIVGPSSGGGSTGGGSIGDGGTPAPAPVTGSGGGSTGGSGGTVTRPATPTVPTDVSLYREGSHTVVVPATPATSKKICLSGEVNRCRTISVPALQAVSMTVSYAANTSATAPTFSVFPCAGGLGVTVAGVTPGTNVTARAQGLDVFGVVGTREVSQSASLCDA